jgi:RNA recognition motif-containing protein
MESKLYVGNLPYNITEDELRTLFAQAGEVKEVAVITDRATGRSKGFGFVEMTTQAEAEKAIQLLNDHDMGGRPLKVSMARPREERSSTGPRSRGGRRGGGRDERRGEQP